MTPAAVDPLAARPGADAPVLARSQHADAWFLPTLLCVVAAVVTARVTLGAVTADDAYITFRYAERLAGGHGFTYNDGARVLGTTTPLYALLLACAAKAGVSLAATALAIATMADAATAVLLARLLRPSAGVATACLAATMFAVWPACLTYAVSGLETSIYTTLVFACLAAATARRASLTGIVCGALVLCRPDGAIAAGVGVWLLWRNSGVRAAMTAAAVGGVVALPWLVFATIYFGSPVPQSVVAKAAIEHAPLTGWRTLIRFFTEGKYALLSCLSAAGWYRLARRPGPARALGTWAVLYALLFAASGAFSDFPWYFNPLLPAYFAGLAAALGAVVERAVVLVGNVWSGRRMSAPVETLVAAVCLVALVLGSANVGRHRAFLLRLAEGRESLYAAVARSLAAEDSSAVMAATEVGTLGYYFPGPVLDLVGLVSPEAVGADPLALLQASHARWLVTYDTHFPREVVASDAFQRRFERLAHVAVSDSRALDVYRVRSADATPAGREVR